jgi:rod shape determining protein RodA
MRNLAFGTVSFVIIGWLIPVKLFYDRAIMIYSCNCVLLLLVLAMGKIAGGSQRWIHLGIMSFQPSELAKLTTAIMVGRFFNTRKQQFVYSLRDLLPLTLAIGFIFVLIFQQPDLGTAGVCLIIAACQLAFVPLDPRSVMIAGSGFLATSLVAWNFLLHSYQKLRILNLLNPNLDPSGSGYNSLQSLVAVGSGGAFGKGFAQGTQTQLKFLPAKHTDFVFSVFAEEHGFWGAVAVVLFFVAYTYIALEVSRKAKDTFCALLAIGVAAIVFIQFSINVAMVLAVFPVVGLPLPFFTYGGSSMLTICIASGLLVAIDRDSVGSVRSSRGINKRE